MKSGKPIKLKKEHSIKFTLQACESVIYKKLEKHAKKGETKELVAAFNDKYEEFNEKERSMIYLLENYKTMLEQFEDTMKHKDLEYFNIKKQVKDFALRMSNMADEKQVEEFKTKIGTEYNVEAIYKTKNIYNLFLFALLIPYIKIKGQSLQDCTLQISYLILNNPDNFYHFEQKFLLCYQSLALDFPHLEILVDLLQQLSKN